MASSASGAAQPSLHARFLVGFIQVPVSLLDFEPRQNHPRELDSRISSRLEDTFSVAFEPDVPDNHIAGVVNESELAGVLHELGVSRSSFRQTIYSGVYPTVQRRIWCPADRHRVTAAVNLFGGDIRWVVQLHCPPDGLSQATYDEFIRLLAERYSPRFCYSDGEIFRNIRRYQSTRPDLVDHWRARLSPSKQVSLNLLLSANNTAAKRRKNLSSSGKTVLQAFDALLVFPGLWEGLELGNLHKHLALHCTDELVRYLQHVHDTWDYITDTDPVVQRCVDINTARRLQSLAPRASTADRDLVCSLLDERRIFSGIDDPLRRSQVRNRLLCLDVVIPSIKSFHENMKLFSTVAKILRTHLLPRKSTGSLFFALKSSWTPPPRSLLEVSEGQFQELRPRLSFDLAYQQIFLAALRTFPDLSDDAPRIDESDRIRPAVRPFAVARFYQKAMLLGFWNEAIRQGIAANDSSWNSVTPGTSGGLADMEAVGIERRWGRPYAKVFRRIQQVAFLHLLQASAPPTTFPTVLYVQRNFLCSFLGMHAFEAVGNVCVTLPEMSVPVPEERPGAEEHSLDQQMRAVSEGFGSIGAQMEATVLPSQQLSIEYTNPVETQASNLAERNDSSFMVTGGGNEHRRGSAGHDPEDNARIHSTPTSRNTIPDPPESFLAEVETGIGLAQRNQLSPHLLALEYTQQADMLPRPPSTHWVPSPMTARTRSQVPSDSFSTWPQAISMVPHPVEHYTSRSQVPSLPFADHTTSVHSREDSPHVETRGATILSPPLATLNASSARYSDPVDFQEAQDYASLPSMQEPNHAVSHQRFTNPDDRYFAGYETPSYIYSSQASYTPWSRTTSRRSVAPSPHWHWPASANSQGNSMVSIDLTPRGPSNWVYPDDRWSIPDARTVVQSPGSHMEGFIDSESDYWNIC